MTPLESAIVGAYTGILAGPFDALHSYIEQIMGRPVYTHELGSKELAAEIKERAKADFVALAKSVGQPTFKCGTCKKEKPLELVDEVYGPDHVETVPLTNCKECRGTFLASLKEGTK